MSRFIMVQRLVFIALLIAIVEDGKGMQALLGVRTDFYFFCCCNSFLFSD